MFRKVTLAAIILFSYSASAGELTGFIALENKSFFRSPVFNGQKMSSGPAIVIEPEYYHVTDDYVNTFTFRPYLRVDSAADKANHADIRQLDIIHAQDSWELQAGVSKVFWGVTESNHLVDIINQTDNLSSFDGEDKLGQSMVQLGLFRDWGTVRLFYMPHFRERTFVGYKDRLRGGVPVEDNNATYDSSSEEWHPDFAVRYQHVIGNWDIGLSHFSGTNREPVFRVLSNADGVDVLVPHYDLIDQTGADIQYTSDGWLWKLEAITRAGQGRRFAAFTGGLEYTLYSVVGYADVGLLAEYQFDDRGSAASATLADNDVFIGTRLTLNDVYDSALLLGASIDHNTGSMAVFCEAERRLGNNWKVELEARFFNNIDSDSPEFSIRNDDHILFNIARYF
jgi:hypothetical protein